MKETPANRRRKRPVRFLDEVRQELSNVTWPTKRQIIAYSMVVLVTVTVLGSFISALDYLFSRLILSVGYMSGRPHPKKGSSRRGDTTCDLSKFRPVG